MRFNAMEVSAWLETRAVLSQYGIWTLGMLATFLNTRRPNPRLIEIVSGSSSTAAPRSLV
jgi:hypothetical protein